MQLLFAVLCSLIMAAVESANSVAREMIIYFIQAYHRYSWLLLPGYKGSSVFIKFVNAPIIKNCGKAAVVINLALHSSFLSNKEQYTGSLSYLPFRIILRKLCARFKTCRIFHFFMAMLKWWWFQSTRTLLGRNAVIIFRSNGIFPSRNAQPILDLRPKIMCN